MEEFEQLEQRAVCRRTWITADIQGLRLEAREKLAPCGRRTWDRPGRISGVSPADMAALMI